MALAIDTPLRPKASTRRWRSRARLAAAVMASLLLHWLLQQGLARTVIAVRPFDGLFPDQEPSYRPELATDFPLHDESSTREAFAHERPLDVPIAIDAAAPASARGAIRDGERAVAEMPLEEAVEAPDVVATRIDRPSLEAPVPSPAAIEGPERWRVEVLGWGLVRASARPVAPGLTMVAGLQVLWVAACSAPLVALPNRTMVLRWFRP